MLDILNPDTLRSGRDHFSIRSPVTGRQPLFAKQGSNSKIVEAPHGFAMVDEE